MCRIMHIMEYHGKANMDLTVDVLEKIAKRVVNEPWGCGDDELAANSESWAPYLRFLNAVVKEFRPQAALECGVYMGTATAHMALANPDTLVIGIDRRYHLNVMNVVGRFDNVVLITGDTVHSYHNVKTALNGRHIGLLFLDSTHDGDTPKKEFEIYRTLMDDICIVACDDLLGPKHLMNKMQEFWHWLPGEKIELHFLHPKIGNIDEPGFGVSIVKRGGL